MLYIIKLTHLAHFANAEAKYLIPDHAVMGMPESGQNCPAVKPAPGGGNFPLSKKQLDTI
jgi:hypothetical protein